MLRLLFENAHSGVAVQALAVVEGGVELYVSGLRDFAEVLHINMSQPAKFSVDCAKHGVVGVAGVAGMIAGNEIILKMPGWDVARIIHVKALAEIVHDMAGEAELSAGGALHVLGVTEADRHNWQDKESDEGQNFSASYPRKFGASGHQNRQHHSDADEKHFAEHRTYHDDDYPSELSRSLAVISDPGCGSNPRRS